MSKRLLAALVIIVVVVIAGMVVTVKRSLNAGALARDPDASVPRTAQPPAKKPD
jgi:hypothetical protein